MRPRRLPAALAILALLLQALLPLAPARAARAVICGADGPVVVLLDLATGQPTMPAQEPGEHGCCAAVCVHCAACPGFAAPTQAGATLGEPARAARPHAGVGIFATAPRIAVRVRGPPPAAHI
jgi:hypothetical protein